SRGSERYRRSITTATDLPASLRSVMASDQVRGRRGRPSIRRASAERQRCGSPVLDAVRMTQADTDRLIRQFIGGDATARVGIVDPAATDLLARSTQLAATTRDRQLVAIATAHLDGDSDRVDALARDHLVDHPDNILVAWIAAAARPATHLEES